uniref:Uncharacterized protein n=2 Tax=Meloidogyne TaxID=189290 RepID=A0A914LM76_MELIC
MDQQMYEHVIEGLKESVIRFSRQISTLEYVRQDDKMLKNELYDAFMQFHEKRYPLAKCQIHEYLLREMNALAKIAITEVVKDELYFELHNPFSKFWGQIDLEMAIKIFNKHGSIHGPIMREDSPIIFMRAHTDSCSTIKPNTEEKGVQTENISDDRVVTAETEKLNDQ